MDFTIRLYKKLLETLLEENYTFSTVSDYCQKENEKSILRHDIDKFPGRSLPFAELERALGINGTYYFRVGTWNENIVSKIQNLGHEVGYHYEDITTIERQEKSKICDKKVSCEGEYENLITRVAIENFKQNLEKFRKIVPIATICMHGSPMSNWDNRLLWKYYDYKDFNIICEPYFNINFSKTLYLTDTGRRWNGQSVAIRDKFSNLCYPESSKVYDDWKVKPVYGSLMLPTPDAVDLQNRYQFKSTNEIISASMQNNLPEKLMLSLHPQRWTDDQVNWMKELVSQSIKNIVKRFLLKLRS